MKLELFLKVIYSNKKSIIQRLEKGTLLQIQIQMDRHIQMGLYLIRVMIRKKM